MAEDGARAVSEASGEAASVEGVAGGAGGERSPVQDRSCAFPRVRSLITLQHILEAEKVLGGSLHRTPLLRSASLGDRLEVDLWLKAELFQRTGSFKARGTLNRLRQATPVELQMGFITASAGNLAQGLAWAAREVGCPVVVVMPEGAPESKVEATRGYGAEVILNGPMVGLLEHMQKVQEARGLTVIHPWDDPLVVAGYGTLALEILEDLPEVSLVVVPVGGGGLIAGLATAIKGLSPGTRVVGVEPAGAAGMHRSLEAGRPVLLSEISTIADGLSAPTVGAVALETVRERVDELVIVTEADILTGLELLMTRAKLYVEGAGAAAAGALLSGKIELTEGEKVVSVVSGGNLDLQRLISAVTIS